MFFRYIPNFITLLNLSAGFISVVCAFNGDLVMSAYFIGIASVLDFLDGFLARKLRVISDIGKQLDSLADLVSFGLAPSVILFHLLIKANGIPPFFWNGINVFGFMALFILIFSALRLAIFNVDSRQSDVFIGLPTPANAMLIASLPLIINQIGSESFLFSILHNFYFLVLFTIFMSYLLVSPLYLISLKFKDFSWKRNKVRYVFLCMALGLVIIFKFVAVPFVILLYVLISLLNNVLFTKYFKK